MAKLTTKGRKALPSSSFALPKSRAYPDEDKGHAEAALGRAAEWGTPSVKAKVRADVFRKYPELKHHAGK